MKRLLISIAVIVLILIACPFFRTRQLERNFEKLKEGDAKQAVLGQMGHPWKDTKCGQLINSAPDCTEELIYANPYAPYVPEYWIFDFNRNQQLIRAYYTTSP